MEDLADSVELRMDYVLQPGDIQLLHNHSIVHARTAYVDHDDVSAPDLLLMWCVDLMSNNWKAASSSQVLLGVRSHALWQHVNGVA